MARSPRLYLVLELASCRLSIRSRGFELDSITPVQCMELVVNPLFGGGERPEIQLPAVWRALEAPDGSWRRVVAPPTLRPYSDDEEEPAQSDGATPTPTPAPIEIPSDYVVRLDSGWELEITSSSPGGALPRFFGAVVSGWRRALRVPQPERPPRIVLQMEQDDARRALHLFQHGVAILLVVEPGESSAPS